MHVNYPASTSFKTNDTFTGVKMERDSAKQIKVRRTGRYLVHYLFTVHGMLTLFTALGCSQLVTNKSYTCNVTLSWL